MKILVVDDERIARNELKYQIKSINEQATILEADSYDSAIELLSTVAFDGAFFDIELPDKSGLELAKTVTSEFPNLPFVFSTAYDTHALTAFELNAIDYILKPYDQQQIRRAYSRFINDEKEAQPCDTCTDKLTVWVKDKAIIIQYSDILYFATHNKETLLYTKHQQYSIKHTLNYLENKLAKHGFMRVQRSYLVNMNEIIEIIPWFNHEYALKVNHIKEVIPVSRNKLSDLKTYFDF